MNTKDYLNKSKSIHSILYTKPCTCTLKNTNDIKPTSKLYFNTNNTVANEYLLGCSVCHSNKKQSTSSIITSKFIQVANIIHDNKYLYVENSSNYICPPHGPQTITNLRDHLLSITPCITCNKERLRNRYIKQATTSNNSITTLYLVKLYNDKETFYKAGLTFESVVSRFKTVPYNLEIITSITGDATTLYDLEQKIHDYHKEQNYSYTPTKEFSGMPECFVASESYINKLQTKIQGYTK